MPESISEKKPWKSGQIGCHESQAAEFNEHLKKSGSSSRMVPDGKGYCQLESRSRRDRARAFEALGYVDREGSYGDYTGR